MFTYILRLCNFGKSRDSLRQCTSEKYIQRDSSSESSLFCLDLAIHDLSSRLSSRVKKNPFGPSQTGGLQSGNRGAYSMRFAAGRSQTMQSVTSGSRSSPPLPRGGGPGRADEQKHANGETQALASPSVEETSVS